MQIKHLFNLLHDTQDLLELFEGVTSTPQMASRLDRLKRGEATQDLLDSLEALRLSHSEAFEANIELGGAMSDDDSDDSMTDDILDGLPGDDDIQTSIAEGQGAVGPTQPASEKGST
jgi:hypothetical protein